MSGVGTNVKIKLISSIIPTDGEKEQYEMWLEGSFVEKNGSHYLRYEEVLDDKRIKTTVKLADGKAIILRSGEVNMRLPLNTDMSERGHYESIYGALPIETVTHTLVVDVDGATGSFNTTYDLIIGDEKVGNYTLQITFTEVK